VFQRPFFGGGPVPCRGVREAHERVRIERDALQAILREQAVERRRLIAVQVGEAEEVVPGERGAQHGRDDPAGAT